MLLPEDRECKFRPQINPVSQSLISHSDLSNSKKPVWESLYKLNSERQQMLENKRKEAELVRQQKDGKFRVLFIVNCTFKPTLVANHDHKYGVKQAKGSLYERAQHQKEKAEKMERLRQEKLKKEVEECTFVPKINQANRRRKSKWVFMM